MEKSGKERRTGLIRLRVSERELVSIQAHFQRSTDRSLSAYLRKLALNKPVTVKVRNVSADDFLRGMLPLKALLEDTCRSYSQAADRLQLLQKIPEFKSWLLLHETTRDRLFEQVSKIDSCITQLYEQWLLK